VVPEWTVTSVFPFFFTSNKAVWAVQAKGEEAVGGAIHVILNKNKEKRLYAFVTN
jgi:hypothetical protein